MFGRVTASKAYPPQLNLQLISRTEQAQFDDLMEKYHRRGALRRIGHELHYVVKHESKWIALISFSPAALKSNARDQWIGWPQQLRTDRLRLIANNSRFLILPGHHYPNLATRILSGCRKRLVTDWQEQFSKPVVMLETFVDSAHHRGTIYRADNWVLAGKTLGYKRIYGGYSQTPTESHKFVFVKPLLRHARRILCAPQLPDAYCVGVEKMNLNANDYCSLYEYFDAVDDFRSEQGKRYSLACVLSLIAAATLSGARGYKGIWIWCDGLSQANRRHFRCFYARGERHVPSITVIRNVIMKVDPEQLQKQINNFCSKHFGTNDKEAVAVDGKTLCGSGGDNQRQTPVMNIVGHQSGHVYAKKVGTLPVNGYEEEKQSNETIFSSPPSSRWICRGGWCLAMR
ncbi:MAG: DUF4338 domain-containing protein [Acidiferrobacterales bacterium]|nr:DUF4338 domain-containing protein [Acidiferrobacterales bacterium]